MAAERYNDRVVVRTQVLVDIPAECQATPEAGGSLCHGWARDVEDAKRKYVCLSKQVRDRSSGQLFLQLIIGEPGGVTNAALESEGPRVIPGAVARVGI
jgi:hypothetical protein